MVKSSKKSSKVEGNGKNDRELRKQHTPPEATVVDVSTTMIIRPAAVVFAMALTIYMTTLYPSLPGGDAGEMIMVADKLGIAHPPGYPLFTLLSKPFTYIPAGGIAWRINFSAAVFGSAAASVLAAATVLWSSSELAGVLAGGMFAGSPTVWRYAVQGEVFALNNFIICLLLLLSVQYTKWRQRSIANLGALVIGLGLANQHTVLLFALPLVAGILCLGRKDLMTVPAFGSLVAWGLAGLLPPYLWLALSGRFAVKHCWGDIASVSGFLTHFLRREYGTFQLAEKGIGQEGLFFERTIHYILFSLNECAYLGAPLVVIGVVAACSPSDRYEQSRGTGWVLLSTYVFYVFAFNILANLPLDPIYLGVQARFWMQPQAIVCILLGVGAKQVSSKWGKRTSSEERSLALASITVVLLALQFGWNYPSQDHSRTTIFDDYGKAVLDSMPQGSLFLMKGDNLVNTIAYLQECEQYRTDIVAVSLGHMASHWFMATQRQYFPSIRFPNEVGRLYSGKEAHAFNAKQFLDANFKRFPDVYIFGFHPGEEIGMPHDNSAAKDYLRLPHGLVSRVVTPDFPFKVSEWEASNQQNLPRFPLPDLKIYGPDSWEAGLRADCILANYSHAHFLLEQVQGLKEKRRESEALREIISIFHHTIDQYPIRAVIADKGATIDIWRLLGTAYAKLVPYDQAAKADALKYLRHYVAIEFRDQHVQLFVQEIKDLIKSLSMS